MKAIEYGQYGSADVLRYVDLPDPVAGRGEILVRLEAASVAPFDCKLRAGLLQAYFTPHMPSVPGLDGAGRVVATGEGVASFQPGDRVVVLSRYLAQGGYAEMIAIDAAKAVRLPAGLSPVEAVAIANPSLSAWSCIRTADVKPLDKVLVHAGAGAVGGVLVQLCRHIGAEVSATCRASNRDYVLGLGADRAIAYDEEDFADHLSEQDVVFDLVGGDVHDRSYRVLKKGGRLAWLVAAPIRDRGAEFGVVTTRVIVPDDMDALRSTVDLVASGVLKPQVCATMALSRAADAHRLVEEGKISRGRLVLTM